VIAEREAAANLARLPDHRREVYEYYRLTFDEDGCPMKQMAEGKTFHPILPPYLICDYLVEYQKTRERSFLQSAESILNSALQRAECLSGATVFMYRPESGLSQHPHPFYSALTQAWYMKAICDLSRCTLQDYRDQLVRVFRSFLIPIDKSGVLVKKEYGWIVEEYPSRPPLYTLNGWLTVLRMIISCREVLERFEIPYQELLDRNLDALEHLLPLYDAGFCLNSRYQLTGFTRLRLVFDRHVSPQVLSFAVMIPGEATIAGNREKITGYRWENYLERTEEKLLQFNVVLSLVSYPAPNVFSCELTVEQDCRAKVFVADGDYRPDLSAMPTQRWRQISSVTLTAAQINRLLVPILFDERNSFAYPTNFKKKIANKFFNAYHFVHVVVLAEIFAFSNRDIFREVALRWLGYYERWADGPPLAGGPWSLIPHKYGDKFKEVIEATLLQAKSKA
jgi:hypothetical protein